MPHISFVKLGAAMGALAATAALAATPAASAAAPAPTGGATYDDPSAPSVFADGSTLGAPLGDLLGSVIRFDGKLAGTSPGDTVDLQRFDRRAGWTTAAEAVVGSDGTFDAAWTADHTGQTTVRVIRAGAPRAASASADGQDGAPAPFRQVTVFRPVTATWYGPGFYGHRTACGVRLRHATLGVANRTLPCGTQVALYLGGRTITVPVIDRGPFRRGTSYDLTAATAQALGMTGTTTLGAVHLAAGSTAPAPPAGA